VLSDWSRDGRFLIYTVVDSKTRADVWYVPVESGKLSRNAVRLVGTDAIESLGQLSPDGKWLAYYSDETGRGQIYVRSFPGGSRVWAVSIDGGREPRWRSDGKELFFAQGTTQTSWTLMAAAVESDGAGGLRIGTPQKLFGAVVGGVIPQANAFAYSPHPDGKRFLVNARQDRGEPTVNVITNWHKVIGEEAGTR